MTARTHSSRPFAASSVVTLLRAHPRETVGGSLLAAAALVGLVGLADPAASLPRMISPAERVAPTIAAPAPPAVEPSLVRDIAPQTAEAINAALPVAFGPNPAARAFTPAGLKGASYDRALECLTEAIYYEAATEPTDGQRAVAQVVLNRVRHPAFPASVCGVVYQGHERRTGCQFTFTCDGSLTRAPMASYWDRARKVALAALGGVTFAVVGNATHYHADWVVPYWAPSLIKSAVIGRHIFYRWAGGWGQPGAFGQRYAGIEPDAGALKADSLRAEAADRELVAKDPAGAGAAGVLKAKQELPPELARLIEAEIGPQGTTRVAMRFTPSAGKKTPIPAHAPLDRPAGSDTLRWSLNGSDGVTAAETPLGRAATKSPPPPATAAATTPAATKP